MQFILHGDFKYNGSSSSCSDAYVEAKNYNTAKYAIISKTKAISGNKAYGYCRARNKNTGTEFARTIWISVSATGTVTKSS
ncbi:MAG: hypothetical protein MSR29_12955 [Lachnospiraceae bacterium]|nr:hypothetical protein [Lachnospiraceae bacterium]